LRTNIVLDDELVEEAMLCEVLQGFRSDADFDRAREAMLAFPIFNTGGQRLAIQSAVNHRKLRQHGITVRKTSDCLIATFVIDGRPHAVPF
jgi:hypothetical protein